LQKAYDRHIRVKNKIPKGLRFRDGFDLNAFDVILYEIVDNMVKYHDFEKTDRYILFDAEYRQETGQYVIVLEDNGMGIEDKERVWEWAYRESHRHPGIMSPGIGLTHVKALVESLGGEIELASTVGEGTRFRIILKRGDIINSLGGNPSPTPGATSPPASVPPEPSTPVTPATSGGSMTQTSAVESFNYSVSAQSYQIDEKVETGNASVIEFEDGGDVTGMSYKIYTHNTALRTKQRLAVNRTMIVGYSVYLKSSTTQNVITRQFTGPHAHPRLTIH
jgi:anti-sigma regulatory factor (Ser/Thr protein kinase)